MRGLRSWHRISAVSIGRPAYPQEFSSCPREAGINSVLQLFVGVWLSVLFPARPEQFDRRRVIHVPPTRTSSTCQMCVHRAGSSATTDPTSARRRRHSGQLGRGAVTRDGAEAAGGDIAGAKLIWGKVLDLVLGGGLVVKQLRQLEGRPFFGACPEARRACGGIVASVGRRPPIASVSDLHATARGGFRTRLAPFSLHVDWSDRMEGAD